jgi:glycosyltransferase involved in cell wall biosynthesis
MSKTKKKISRKKKQRERKRKVESSYPTIVNPDDLRKHLKGLDLSAMTPKIDIPKNAVPVSVCMITKNCAEGLDRALASLFQGFMRGDDEIVVVDTGSTDNTVSVAKKYGARVIERPDLKKDIRAKVEAWCPEVLDKWDGDPMFDGGCIMDFAEARQIGTDAAKYDAVFWIDSDDEFREKRPGRFRQLVDENWDRTDAVYLPYYYAFDKEDKQCTTILKRERLVDRRNFVWKGRCHETFIPRPGANLRRPSQLGDEGIGIVHTGHRVDHQISDVRNYCIIRTEIEDDLVARRDPDVRSIFYLGNACRGLKKAAESLEMYRKTLELSGSRDDRYSSAYYSGIIHLSPELKRPVSAMDYAQMCIRIKPEDPRGYFMLSRCYAMLMRWNESLHWFKVGRMLPEPTDTLHSYDPQHIYSLPMMVAIEAARHLGDEELVAQLCTELAQKRAEHPEVKTAISEMQNWYAGKKLTKAVQTILTQSRITNTFQARAAANNMYQELKFVPKELEEMGLGKFEPDEDRPKPDAGKDLVIFCGHTAEPWGPKNRKTGIGGSEKMVLEMVSRLAKRGFRVSVYANVPPDQRGVDEDGVLWRHYAEMDYQRWHDTVIFWRSAAPLDLDIPCGKRIVWCHDVQSPGNWTDERIALVDEVWVLTEYHADTLGMAREKLGDKVRITRNGIDAELFKTTLAKKPERKANRVVFCSSPDRGILTAIRAFKKAFEKDPNAELHLCYGFSKAYWHIAAHSGYLHMCDLGRQMDMYEYFRLVFAAIDADPRIHFYGRLSWEKVAELLCSSGVWLYPTRFTEISCMAAMEAQAAGCAIVATQKAALAETVNWDARGTYPTVIETAAEALKAAATTEFDRSSLSENALNRFNFEGLADEWAEILTK